ncbi:MAG: hypothetical protein ACI8S6_003885 [Myxococcota bacterium]|jgi:hypothetical protein
MKLPTILSGAADTNFGNRSVDWWRRYFTLTWKQLQRQLNITILGGWGSLPARQACELAMSIARRISRRLS